MAKRSRPPGPADTAKPRARRATAPIPAPDTIHTAADAPEAIASEMPAPDRILPGPTQPAASPYADRVSVSMGSEPSEADIRMRAYHLFLERGAVHGADIADWFRAEEELRKK
jgi:hypothetical protein